MKRSIPGFLLFSALFAACSSTPKAAENTKGLLPANLVNNPQTASGVAPDKSAMPQLALPDSTHDFGSVTEGEKVEHEFTFTNTGGGPLIISGADAGCGCTVTDYPHSPVAPGKGGAFRVVFNSAGKMGHQEKIVTISSNAANGAKYLKITADVATKK